ncbi:MAG: hypothetical protein FWE05_05990 [Defluviitaleaceae bacterium]|nr:hypothetical protein [Defluviitaleaceae bacterium]
MRKKEIFRFVVLTITFALGVSLISVLLLMLLFKVSLMAIGEDVPFSMQILQFGSLTLMLFLGYFAGQQRNECSACDTVKIEHICVNDDDADEAESACISEGCEMIKNPDLDVVDNETSSKEMGWLVIRCIAKCSKESLGGIRLIIRSRETNDIVRSDITCEQFGELRYQLPVGVYDIEPDYDQWYFDSVHSKDLLCQCCTVTPNGLTVVNHVISLKMYELDKRY